MSIPTTLHAGCFLLMTVSQVVLPRFWILTRVPFVPDSSLDFQSHYYSKGNRCVWLASLKIISAFHKWWVWSSCNKDQHLGQPCSDVESMENHYFLPAFRISPLKAPNTMSINNNWVTQNIYQEGQPLVCYIWPLNSDGNVVISCISMHTITRKSHHCVALLLHCQCDKEKVTRNTGKCWSGIYLNNDYLLFQTAKGTFETVLPIWNFKYVPLSLVCHPTR